MEASSKKIEVLIDGQVVKLMAHESEDYIRQVAKYIDNKISEVSKMKSGIAIDTVTRWLLVALNIADELFKEKNKHSGRDLELELTEAKLEIEKYMDELQKIQEENILLNEKIGDLQFEVIRVRKEFDDFLDAFDTGLGREEL